MDPPVLWNLRGGPLASGCLQTIYTTASLESRHDYHSPSKPMKPTHTSIHANPWNPARNLLTHLSTKRPGRTASSPATSTNSMHLSIDRRCTSRHQSNCLPQTHRTHGGRNPAGSRDNMIRRCRSRPQYMSAARDSRRALGSATACCRLAGGYDRSASTCLGR